MADRIRLLTGQDAAAWLAEAANVRDWDRLRTECPWATGYQSRAFAHTWYGVYRDQFEPLLVIGEDQEGQMSGLLPLARSRQNHELGVAGSPQCEYQAWIARPEQGDAFALNAVLALRERFPGTAVSFRYLPPGAPTRWLHESTVASAAQVISVRRPIVRLKSAEAGSLFKPNNKKRLRALRKLGPIEFRHVTDPLELEKHIDELAELCDVRQLAMYGIEPFADDPFKKPFHLAMMRQPGLLHVTLLKVGSTIASAHLNLLGERHVQLNLILHNPLLARHSPGKLHIHMLAGMLAEQGYEYLDLTPGGESYKDRFANFSDEAKVVTIHPDRVARWRGSALALTEKLARSSLRTLNIHPTRAKQLLGRCRASSLAELTRGSMRRFASRKVWQVYTAAAPRLSGTSSETVSRDRLADLRLYRPAPGQPTRQRIMHQAMQALEEGQHFYTRVVAGRLQLIAWAIEHPSDTFISRRWLSLALPADHSVLLGVQNLTEASGEELHGFLAEVIDRMLESGRSVFMAVPIDDQPLVAAAEVAGMVRGQRISEVRWLGRVNRHRVDEANAIPRLANSSL